MLHIIF